MKNAAASPQRARLKRWPPLESSAITAAIRNATPDDAEAIYALKVAAFGQNFLPFTIYRSSKSLGYLRELIRISTDPGAHARIKVVADHTSVLGYYHAAPVGASYFLNYIAVSAGSHYMGLGGRLLSDFETTGKMLGFASTELDVFTSNRGVPEWYFRRGYRPEATRYHTRISLSAVPPGHDRIEWRSEDWNAALADEEVQGFAKLHAWLGGSVVELGLIDRCAVKLLSWSGLALPHCVSAIAVSFAASRSELIVSGLNQSPVGLPCIAVEPALRLTRDLEELRA